MTSGFAARSTWQSTAGAASPGSAPPPRCAIAGGIFLPGGKFAASEDELKQYPGFGTDIEAARAEARRLLKEAGQENLTFNLTVRNGPPIVVDFGVFLIDQWRQIGVNANNVVVETPPWAAAINSGDFEAIIDIYSALREEPTEQMTKYVSHDVSARSAGRFTDRELDDLWTKQSTETDAGQASGAAARFREAALRAVLFAAGRLARARRGDEFGAQGLDLQPQQLPLSRPVLDLAGRIVRRAGGLIGGPPVPPATTEVSFLFFGIGDAPPGGGVIAAAHRRRRVGNR